MGEIKSCVGVVLVWGCLLMSYSNSHLFIQACDVLSFVILNINSLIYGELEDKFWVNHFFFSSHNARAALLEYSCDSQRELVLSSTSMGFFYQQFLGKMGTFRENHNLNLEVSHNESHRLRKVVPHFIVMGSPKLVCIHVKGLNIYTH